jgi:DNA-binding HxlR family transcriptional regulator
MSRLREAIIKSLLEAPTLRFTDLYEACDYPSKSHFSHELRNLQSDGIVTRNPIDYKNVEYSLNREKYEALLLEEERKLQLKLKQAQEQHHESK